MPHRPRQRGKAARITLHQGHARIHLGVARLRLDAQRRRKAAGFQHRRPVRVVIAQHHRLPLQGPDQFAIPVEAFGQLLQLFVQHRAGLALAAQPFAHARQGIVTFRLGEQHVIAQHGHLLALQQLLAQAGQHAARPGPAAILLQALLVDIDDDDALIQRGRRATVHQHHVVHLLLEPGDGAVLHDAQGMRQHHQQGHQPQQHAAPAARTPQVQALTRPAPAP